MGLKGERGYVTGSRQWGCPRRVLAWIPVHAGTRSVQFQQSGAELLGVKCPDRRADLELVVGGSFQSLAEPPDSRRLFRAIMARIEAGDADALASEVPLDREDSPQTSVAKGIVHR